MRISVLHRTTYEYEGLAKGVIQIVRKTPRSHAAQHVLRWRIDVNEDCQLIPYHDAFGNIAQSFSVDTPVTRLEITVEGEVETHNADGVVAGALERFPPALYLRETPLTQLDGKIAAFAEALANPVEALATLHTLQNALHEHMSFEVGASEPSTSAKEAFANRRGVCQDYAHIFIAAARHLGIPARYVAGHLLRQDKSVQEAGHAWAEAYVPDLGWVAFDPANNVCATEAYIRVAVALDYLGAAPIRGSVYGMARETMTVAVDVGQQMTQRQG